MARAPHASAAAPAPGGQAMPLSAPKTARCSLTAALVTALAAALPSARADVITSQQPVSGGGTARWSQLWQDPGPNGNDLDGDAVCWEDFTLSAPASINHIEWWGT